MTVRWADRWVACGLVAVLAACSGDGAPGGAGAAPDEAATATSARATATTTTAPQLVEQLGAAIERSRVFGPQHMFELVLVDHGTTSRPVTAYRLDSPLFDGLDPHEREVRPWTGGVRTTVPLPYGAPRCDVAAGGGSAVEVVVDGETLRLPVDEAPLRQQHRDECAHEAVVEAVELRFGDRWQRQGERLATGTLELSARREGVVAVVEGIAGTVIFTVRPHAPIGGALQVGDGEPEAAVAVDVEITGCSAHALIESKKTYRFPTWVSLDGAPAVRIELEPTGPARAAMERLLADCQAAPAG